MLTPGEHEVFDYLARIAPAAAGAQEVATATGRTEGAMRKLLPRMVREGKLHRTGRGLYTVIVYTEAWRSDRLPGLMVLKNPGLTPAGYEGPAADFGFLVSALHGMADRYTDTVGAEVAGMMHALGAWLERETAGRLGPGGILNPESLDWPREVPPELEAKLNALREAAAAGAGRAGKDDDGEPPPTP